MRVLAIDPGERFGWAHGVVGAPPEAPPRTASLEVTGHGISHAKDFLLKLHAAAGSYDVIVFETYRISAAKLKAHIGSDVPTLQFIGALRLCAWLNPSVQLVSQGPDVKSTADASMPDWLRAKIAALPKAHDDSHDGDALRHLWFWFWKRYV